MTQADSNHASEGRGPEAVDVSVCIAHRENAELLLDCIESIHQSTDSLDVEVIVTDNASTDGSVGVACDRFPETKVVRSDAPLGYGAANNRAFEASSGRYVLVLNDDTIVRPHALDAMVALMDENPSIGCVGCRLINEDGSLQHSCSVDPTVLNQIAADLLPDRIPGVALRTGSRLKHWNHDTQRDVDVISGAAMLIRRDVYAALGGFDEGYVYFVEEFDLCHRIRQAGYRIVFTPNAEIVHLGGQTMKIAPAQNYITFQRSRERYFRKHHGAWQAYLLRGTRFLGIAIRYLLWLGFTLVRPRARSRVKDRLRTYRQVLPCMLSLRNVE